MFKIQYIGLKGQSHEIKIMFFFCINCSQSTVQNNIAGYAIIMHKHNCITDFALVAWQVYALVIYLLHSKLFECVSDFLLLT